MNLCLLDTGPVVSLLDPSEREHSAVSRFLRSFRAEFVTTGAVTTEAFHFLSGSANGPSALVEFLSLGNIRIADCFALESLRSATTLMQKYADLPMDFADASLVLLAERMEIGEVLTLDERGFRAFRHRRNRKFRLVLQDGFGAR